MKNIDITITELFDDWTEPDLGEYYVACLLGVMEYDADLDKMFSKAKGVFRTKNKVGDALFHILEELVEAGFLLKNEECQYRCNKSFKGFWESHDKV